MSLNKKFQSILWEYDLSTLNLDDNIVVQRVLSLGEKDITTFWRRKIGKEKAKKVFLKNKLYLDKKSLNYWNIIFDIKKDKNLENNRTMYEKLNKPIFTRSFR